MSVDYSSPIWAKNYEVPPERKTLQDCRSHGSDHACYRWSPKIDPRWSIEQKLAYIQGYESVKRPSSN